MQYDGLDQTGKTLVTPLLSSQGRVMIGKCDEIGGPYLQVMEDELIDTIAATPVAISHPQKTFTGGIASADEQDNRNIIFKVLQELPIYHVMPKMLCWRSAILNKVGAASTISPRDIFFKINHKLRFGQRITTVFSYPLEQTLRLSEMRARSITTYIVDAIAAAEVRVTSIYRSVAQYIQFKEAAWKEYALQLIEDIKTADIQLLKTAVTVRTEFVNLVLRTPRYLSGIVEDGRAVFVSAVSETGRVVTSIAEDGRAAFSSIQHYISGDFYITVQKTFRHTVSTSIERDPLSLAAAPYIENMGVRQLIRCVAFLQPYVDGIAVAYENGKTTVARYCNEKMRAALLHTIQLTTSIPTYLSVSDIRKTFSWIDIPEVISGIDSRINNISSSLKEHIEAAVTQWKEYGLQFTHNLGVAETSARALTTYRTEFINLVLRVPKLLSGLSETGHMLYNNALSEIGRAATQISEEGRAVVCSLSHSSPAGFTVELQRILKDKVAASHDRITNASRTYRELAMSIDLRVNHITMNVREAITYVEVKTSHATKYILNLLDTEDVAITHDVSKMLAQRISAAETHISSVIHYLTESTVYSGIANSRFAVTLSDGVALIDNTAALAIVNLKEKYNLVERKLTNIPYELKELFVFSSNYITRSWVDVKETLKATPQYIVDSTYNIKQKIITTSTDILHPQPSIFTYGLHFSDTARYSPTKIFSEAVTNIGHQFNHVAKPLLQNLRLWDNKTSHVAKLLLNGISTAQQFGRQLRVQRVEFINIILSIPKQLSGITETGLVYLQNSITEVGDTVSTLSSNGRLTISYIVESTQSGFTKTVVRPIRERLLTSHTIISRSMIHLLEETLLRFVVISSPLKRFVETIITSGSHLQQLLHVLKETTSMMYSRQSRVTSQLVHRLGIRDIEILNTWRAFIHSISTSHGFLRRPQLILRERVASSHITSRIITSYIGEILRTLQIHSTSMFYNIKESISTIQSFRHRLAGLVTRPYTEIKSISKTTGARLSRNFATLKSYIKDSTASYEGDKK